jgi:hypothetical protein
MIDYQQALARYERATAPVRSTKWLVMPDNPRYLTNVSQTHYGIHKKDDGTIYYRLYTTNIATFSPPDENGEYKVEIRYVSTTTTNNFLWLYGLSYYSLTTTDNKNVVVPYVQSGVGGVRQKLQPH